MVLAVAAVAGIPGVLAEKCEPGQDVLCRVAQSGLSIRVPATQFQEAEIYVELVNKQDRQQDYVNIIMIRQVDSDEVVFIGHAKGRLDPSEKAKPGPLTWPISTGGKHEITSFVWRSLENPDPLARQAVLGVDVTEYPRLLGENSSFWVGAGQFIEDVAHGIGRLLDPPSA